MREILFRGKDIKGNWYEGLLAHNIAKDEWYISNKAGISTAYQVRPETIGQFTGLTDKNGTKIFEGDIVEYTTKLSRNTEGIVNVYEIKYSKEQARFIAFLPNGVFDPVAMRYGKVIGNIYDNPELIGGNEDENSI
jgi:hypothetical protein